jgi:uncharacterized protein (TIGR03437 family)
VIFNVNSSGISPISAAPAALNFTFQPNSSAPQTSQVALSAANNAGVAYTVTTSTSGGGAWLSASPNAGATPTTLSVSVNPSTLAAGTYYGAVAINPPGTSGLIIPVQVSVAAPATLTVAPAQLSFAYQTTTAAPAAQVNVTSNGTSPVTFTASAATTSCGSNWLVVTPQSSATPSVLSVQINPAGLQAGNCTGTVNISAPGASNPSLQIPVSLLVSDSPLLQIPSAATTFSYQLGTAIPASQTVQVTSSSTPLNFTVATAPVGNGPNFLTVTPASGATPQALTLALNPQVLSGLAPNTYAQTVTISSPGAGNATQSFTVTLNVSNNPMLLSSQQSVAFNYQIGQTAPQSQTITLTSNGSPLSYSVAATASTCPGFLTATPATGTTAYQAGQQSQVVVSVSTANISTPQTCTGQVSISVPGSTMAPLNIPVTLNASNTPLVNLSPAAINIVTVPGAALAMRTIALTSTDSSMPLNFTATAVTNPIGLTWLSVAPNTGNSPATLNVTINPANLQPGVYTGSINVSSTAAGVSPQSIPVTLTVATGTAQVTPSTLTFTQATGGPVPAAQTLTVAGVPAGTTVGAIPTFFNGTNWLTVTTSGNTLTITPAGGSLTAGTYSGVVTVFVPGAANSPFYVPVTYTVGASGTGPFTVSPTSVNFNWQGGSTAPQPQTVQLTSASGSSVAFTAVAALPPGTAGGNVLFATVSPASGNTPATLSIGLNTSVANTLAPGTYTNNINLTSTSAPGSTQTIAVTLTVTSAGVPTIASVQNAASFQNAAIAPGQLVSIFGSNIGPAQAVGLTLTPSGNVSTNIGNVRVTFNGVAAPLVYVSANQVNAVVPYEIAGASSATVVVTNNNTASANFQVNVASTAPAVFALTQNGSGQGAILNEDGSINGVANAAKRGSVIAIYATGGGQLNPQGITGSVTPASGTSFPMLALTPAVMIGGVPAEIRYAGAAPGLVSGVIQINVVVPPTAATGDQPVMVTVGGVSSPSAATVALQ